MEVISARVNSFKKSKRVKNPEKPSSTATLKWPHPPDFKANPETLAEAGFYYAPAYDDPDNVTCYVCEKELGGWEEDDDPFLLHWVKCGQRCCWASVRCGLSADIDQSGRLVTSEKTRNPSHKLMEKARLETFSVGKGWIHDQAKAHGTNSAIMARAGFVYTPQHSGDDLATCLYCGVSLSGWDVDDDPMEEHRKRAAKSDISCAFFQALEPPSRSQSAKPPSKAQGKPSSRSMSKSKQQDIIAANQALDDEEDESDAVEAPKATKSTAKTPRKPRSTSSSTTKKSTAKTPKAKARSTSRSGLRDVAEGDEEEEVEMEVEAPKTVKKKAPSRSKHVAKTDVREQEDDVGVQPPATVKKKLRVRSKSVAKVQPAVDVEDDTIIDPPAVVKKKTKPQPKATELEVDSGIEVTETRKPSRKGKKPAQESTDEIVEEDVPRKSSRAKVNASTVLDSQAMPRKVSRTKAKSSVVLPMTSEEPRKTSRANSKAQAPDSEQENVLEASEQEAPPRTTAKPKTKRAASKSKPNMPIAVSETDSADDEENFAEAIPKKSDSLGKSKATRPVEMMNAVDDDIFSLPHPPPLSDLATTTELPPLFIPKRKTPTAAPSKQPPQLLKAAVQAKPAPSPPKARKVVEISSDEESDIDQSKQSQVDNIISTSENAKPQTLLQPQFKTPPRPSSRAQHKKAIVVETIQPSEDIQPSVQEHTSDNDFTMGQIELDVDQHMGDVPAPSTPPRQVSQPVHSRELLSSDDSIKPLLVPSIPPQHAAPGPPAQPLFVPPLSKLPFMPMQNLTDAELDMTVEEWIRYQMDVEFDKFRRDGERELQQFRKKAEEARKTIERL